MDDLTAFLNARLDEDEAAAEAAKRVQTEWYVACDDDTVTIDALREHIGHLSPARVLREVAAKRRILADHAAGDHWCARPPDPDWVVYEAGEAVRKTYPCGTARDLASAYSDHPDYQPDWKP